MGDKREAYTSQVDQCRVMLHGTARRAGRLVTAARVLGRVFSLDTNPVPERWRHVTKVDPERAKRLPVVYPLYLRHTDAVSVGGSRDVTPANTEMTFDYLRRVPTPAFHEPSAPAHVTDGSREAADFLAIPEVLNGDVDNLVGKLGTGIDHVRNDLAPDVVARAAPGAPPRLRGVLSDGATAWLLATAAFEAYIIQNPDCAAAREANVGPDDVLGPDEARRRAMAAERRLGSEVVYVEYSGTYGDEEGEAVLRSVADGLGWSRLWYGGGIDSRTDTERMLEAGADAVVVGDAFHAVAEEEARLCETASVVLAPDAEARTVRSFVREELGADSRATRYLSTVPSVKNPVETAVDYNTAAVRLRLGVEALATDLDPRPDERDLKRLVTDHGVTGEGTFARAFGGRGRAVARETALALLGTHVGVETSGLPEDHLAIEVYAPESESE